MSYHLQYRPHTWEDVVGHSAIVTILQNSIKMKRVSPAYLLSGTRGVGKTSIARIFAMALNCENPQDGSPCLECESCKEALEGKSLLIHEIDAASNRGVDDVRDLRNVIRHMAPEGKYRVFILDEAHALTQVAAQALLKTLEEPFEWIVFILCTTEPHKLPTTIRSRCLNLPLRNAKSNEIVASLREICDTEEIVYDDTALLYLSRIAQGSFRDAQVALESVVSLGDVSLENVRLQYALADPSEFLPFFQMLLDNEKEGLFLFVDKLYDAGLDLFESFDIITRMIRDLLCGAVLHYKELSKAYVNLRRRFTEEQLMKLADLMFPLMEHCRIARIPHSAQTFAYLYVVQMLEMLHGSSSQTVEERQEVSVEGAATQAILDFFEAEIYEEVEGRITLQTGQGRLLDLVAHIEDVQNTFYIMVTDLWKIEGLKDPVEAVEQGIIKKKK